METKEKKIEKRKLAYVIEDHFSHGFPGCASAKRGRMSSDVEKSACAPLALELAVYAIRNRTYIPIEKYTRLRARERASERERAFS